MQPQAEATLRTPGSRSRSSRCPNDASPGTVLEQDPPAGSRADEGSTVTITVSTGLGTVPVPDVAGKPEKRR